MLSESRPTPLPEADPLERLSAIAQKQRGLLAQVARQEGLGPEEALDCVQQGLCTLLDLIQTGQLLAEQDEPTPLLITIVRNAARNQRRRHFRKLPHVEISDDITRDMAIPLQEELLESAEQVVRLRACVAQLCDIQQAVVTLRLLEEKAGDDVAELLGVSKNHVAVLLYRAKSALRDCMEA